MSEQILTAIILGMLGLLGFCAGVCTNYVALRIVPKEKRSTSRIRFVVVGLILAVIFILLHVRFGFKIHQMSTYMMLVCLLCCVALVDFDTFTIPNGFIVAGIILWFVGILLTRVLASSFTLDVFLSEGLGSGFWFAALDGLLGGVVVGGLLFLISLVFTKVTGRDSLGGGDIKLLFMTGLFLGLIGNFINLVLSCILGLLLSLVLFLISRFSSGKKEKNESFRTRPFPFGPAIAASTVLVILFGGEYLTWYEVSLMGALSFS